MIELSIIIPTHNRSETLKDTLESLKGQILNKNLFEIIVCDNNSTDNTEEVANSFKGSFLNFKYAKNSTPGLHVGRNLGLQLAQGEIVSYLDDDVIVDPGWGEAVLNRFQQDKDIVMVGGPCRPLWEGDRPDWLKLFIKIEGDRWELSELSLIDLGQHPKKISCQDVYGCNFSIKRDVLNKFGGFHPDGLPNKYLKYRGDGESWFEPIIVKNQMKVFYEPRAAILHRVSGDRMTPKYFSGIARRGAYGEAYTKFRSLKDPKIGQIKKEILKRIHQLICASLIRLKKHDKEHFTREDYWLLAHWFGLLQFIRIIFSPRLRKWVNQSTYFKEDWCPYASSEKIEIIQ